MHFDFGSLLIGLIPFVIVLVMLWNKKSSLKRWVGKLLNQSEVYRRRYQAESLDMSGTLEVAIARPYREPDMCLVSLIRNCDGRQEELDRRRLDASTPLALFETASKLASELSGMQIIKPLSEVMVKVEYGYKVEDYEGYFKDLNVHYTDSYGNAKQRQANFATAQSGFQWGDIRELFMNNASIAPDGRLVVKIVECPDRMLDGLTADMRDVLEVAGLEYSQSGKEFAISGKPCQSYASILDSAKEPLDVHFPNRRKIKETSIAPEVVTEAKAEEAPEEVVEAESSGEQAKE